MKIKSYLIFFFLIVENALVATLWMLNIHNSNNFLHQRNQLNQEFCYTIETAKSFFQYHSFSVMYCSL